MAQHDMQTSERTGRLFAAGEALGFPPVRLRRAVTLCGGFEMWRRYLAAPTAEELDDLERALGGPSVVDAEAMCAHRG